MRSVAESIEHSARQKQLANVSLTVFPDILYVSFCILEYILDSYTLHILKIKHYLKIHCLTFLGQKNQIVLSLQQIDNFKKFCKKTSLFKTTIHSTCSTLINFLSFAQLSLISKKMSALTLSLLFSKIECAPDHHSFIKSALFFQSFSFPNFQ